MEKQRLIPCPVNNDLCPYKDTGCFESDHHIWPKRTAQTRLQRMFGNLYDNKARVCRNIHDTLDTFPAPEYPNPTIMRGAIQRERELRG